MANTSSINLSENNPNHKLSINIDNHNHNHNHNYNPNDFNNAPTYIACSADLHDDFYENLNGKVAPPLLPGKFEEDGGRPLNLVHSECREALEVVGLLQLETAACEGARRHHHHDAGACCTAHLHKNCSDHSHHSRLISYLYISYLLCRWGDRMWEFAVGLFMAEIWKKSLFLTSLYGLVETASVVALGVVLGKWVDRFPRLKVIQTSLALQNISVFSATLGILVLLLKPWPTAGGGFIVFGCLVGLVNVLGGISALASLATKISLERDWVVIMAAEHPSGDLTKMNGMMRRIDLSCTLLAAVVVGMVMSAASIVASAILIATWNLTCVGIEYWLLLTVYNKTPRLHERKFLYHLASKLDIAETKSQAFTEPAPADKISCRHDAPFDICLKSFQQRLSEFRKHGTTIWHKLWSLSVFEGWKIYLRQENMLAGIAFSLLSLSVLSFGTLMTASLKWRGCPPYVLGLARGCAALIGICATLTYPLLHARLQTLRAGMFSITLQWSFLTLCVVSILPKNLDTSTTILMVGAAAARAGLWMFDLSVTQLMQESVPEIERGVVAGVQNSMQSFFHLLSFVVGMIIPHPQDFNKLVLMSFGSVTMAALIYAIQVYNTCINRERLLSFFR